VPPISRPQLCLLAAAVALVAGCASNKPAPAPQQPIPVPEPVKQQEATPLERATIKTELGAGYYERGQFDVAIEVLDEAQKLAPNYPKVYDIYGLVYTVLGENQKAEANFRRALTLAPGDPEIRANWGAFLCATGRIRESIPEFEAALADPLYKKPEIALINAGKCTWALGDTKKADEYFRKAMGVSPGNATAAFQLALLAYRQARLDDARYWLRPVMQQGTPRPEALYLGVCVERKLGDRQAELSYTSQLKNRYPDSAETKQVVEACE
jgi:type IV pilus assembly protein PilF